MSDAELARLGRGLVEANRRLGQVLELLRERPAPDAHEAALLDLLEAVDDARRAHPELDGLGVAAGRAEEHLRRHGLRAIAPDRAFDPALHHAVQALPTPDPSLHGTIADVHARGWRRDDGAVVRYARVSVWRAP